MADNQIGRSFFRTGTGRDATVVVNMLPALPVTKLGSAGYGMGINRLLALDRPPNGPAEADLAGDLFYYLYLSNPRFKDEIPMARGINARLLEWIGLQAGWTAAKNAATYSIAPAAEAARVIWLHLTNEDVIKEALKKQEEANLYQTLAEAAKEKANALDKAAADMREAAEAAGGEAVEDADNPAAGQETPADGDATTEEDAAAMAAAAMGQTGSGRSAGGPTPEDLEDMAAEAHREARENEAKAEAAAKAAEAALDKAEDMIQGQTAVMSAAQEGAEEANLMVDVMAGWGLGHSDPVLQDPAVVQDLMRKMTPYVRKIAQIAGRLKGFTISAKRERIPQSPQVTQIDKTEDPGRILQTEALKLADPQGPDYLETASAFLEGGLPGWTPEGDHEREGDVVICTDISGSMGDADQLAKGLGLAIAQTKKADGRRYALISFSDDIAATVTNRDSMDQHIRYAATRVGMGTNFKAALKAAVDFLGRTPKADLVFISDGQAPVDDETRDLWAEYKAETGARLFFVQVGGRSWQGIKDLADETRHIRELTEGTARDLARDFGKWIV